MDITYIADDQRDFAEERANVLVMHEECEGCHICRKGAYSDRATDPDNARKAYQTYLKDSNALSGSVVTFPDYSTYTEYVDTLYDGDMNEHKSDMSDVPVQTATSRREEQELDMYDMYDMSTNSGSDDIGDMSDAFYASDPYDEDED